MTDDRVIFGLSNLPAAARGCALTIGDFDGVHLGHQQILSVARKLADADGVAVAAMTFDPPPERVLHPDAPLDRITPADVKFDLLLSHGADFVIVVRDDPALMAMSPREFVELLVRQVAPRHVVEGDDFLFGRGRSGNVHTLADEGRRLGFAAHAVPEVEVEIAGESQRVSSTLIRRLVAAGDVASAATCMRRNFALYGEVIPGAGHGRILEFPTANIDAGEQVCPADGVYAARARIGGDEFPAAVSIGNKPTLGPSPTRFVEAFLIGGHGDYYGQRMRLEFINRLRGQQKFSGADELRRQIKKDVERVRQVCG